jgi:hypothetical protein
MASCYFKYVHGVEKYEHGLQLKVALHYTMPHCRYEVQSNCSTIKHIATLAIADVATQSSKHTHHLLAPKCYISLVFNCVLDTVN